MDNVIVEQLSKYFKEMMQEIMLKEREAYLKDHIETRGNGYYKRIPKTIFGDMDLEIPRTRDGNFKPSIIPERKRVTFMLDDVVRALFPDFRLLSHLIPFFSCFNNLHFLYCLCSAV
jgi:putative transposase